MECGRLAEPWQPFRPTELSPIIDFVNFGGFDQYLSQTDWGTLGRVTQERYEPPIAAQLLMATHRLLDQGQLKYALVEGASAAEIAADEYVRSIPRVTTASRSRWRRSSTFRSERRSSSLGEWRRCRRPTQNSRPRRSR